MTQIHEGPLLERWLDQHHRSTWRKMQMLAKAPSVMYDELDREHEAATVTLKATMDAEMEALRERVRQLEKRQEFSLP